MLDKYSVHSVIIIFFIKIPKSVQTTLHSAPATHAYVFLETREESYTWK